MEPTERFDELHVVSDLHMGGETGFQIFKLGDVLARAIEAIRKRAKTKQIALLINGDMVDFLAEDIPMYFDPDGAIAKLDRIVGDDAFKPVFKALRQFVQTDDRTLIINLGNHDLELALPWVREHFLDVLSGGQDQARGRIRLAFDGTGYRCDVGHSKVLCLHGNEVDAWNVCDYEMLRRQGRDRNFGHDVKPWLPNAGAKMVIDVMNEIKKQFPFVDLLKPELEAVVPTLLALNPDAKPRVSEAFGIAKKLTRDKIRRWFGFLDASENGGAEYPGVLEEASLDSLLQQTYGSPLATPQRDGGIDELLRETDERLERGVNPMDLISNETAQQQLGGFDAIVKLFRGKPQHEVLREALEGLAKNQSFDLKNADSFYKDLDELVDDKIDFLCAGHTHLERALHRSEGSGVYYNSGTWVRLIRLSPDILGSAEQFKRYYEAFKKGKMQALDDEEGLVELRPVVVSITSSASGVKACLNRVNVKTTGKLFHPVANSEFKKG